MYDEYRVVTAFDLNTESEVMHINLKQHNLIQDRMHSNSLMPKRHAMNITEDDYQEYLDDLSFSMSEFKKWMNDVVLRGDRVIFPYHMNEFETSVKFSDEQMRIMIEIEDLAYKWLEHEFWLPGDEEEDKNGVYSKAWDK